MQSLVTVIIPTFNRAVTIKRCIDSVLEQTYKELELIVVDDGSSDETVEIVNSYQDERVHLICLDENCGANVARNRGISIAKGEYIAFQDSDDEWLKDKLEIQIKYMKEMDKKVCYCPYVLHQDNTRKIVPEHIENKELYENKIVDVLKKMNVVPTPTLVIHQDVIKTVGMFDETICRLQDYEYAIRICQKYKVAFINKPLVNVYRMKNCITNNSYALVDAYKKIFMKHIDFIDVESFLYTYLYYCEMYDVEGIYIKDLDEMRRTMQKVRKTEKIEKCIKIMGDMIYWFKFSAEKIFEKEFVIYGAGFYGKKAYYALKDNGTVPKYFWVTHEQQETNIDGIPILKIPDKIDEHIPVIICVGKKTQDELIRNLISRGIRDYCVFPFAKI